jgi:hypothetical protein
VADHLPSRIAVGYAVPPFAPSASPLVAVSSTFGTSLSAAKLIGFLLPVVPYSNRGPHGLVWRGAEFYVKPLLGSVLFKGGLAQIFSSSLSGRFKRYTVVQVTA